MTPARPRSAAEPPDCAVPHATRRAAARSRALRPRTAARRVARCSSPSRMRPARANAASSSSCTRRSNGASSQPLLRDARTRSSSSTRVGEMLEQRDAAAAQPAPLRGEPAVEARTAIDLEAVEKVAAEQRRQRCAAARRRASAPPRRGVADELERIDEAVREVEPHACRRAPAPGAARLVDDAAELAEAPAQFAARIVRRRPTAARTAGCASRACGARAR